MNEKQKKTGKLSRFFEEKGFYIILFLCVAAIGIAGYVLFIAPNTAGNTADTPDSVLDALPDTNDSQSSVPSATIPDGLTPNGTVIPSSLDSEDLPPDSSAVSVVEPDDTAAPADAGKTTDSAVEAMNPSNSTQQQETKTPTQNTEKNTTQAKPAADNMANAAPDFFVKPVSGDIIRDFCVTELVYDRTMGDWRTHNGADFSATTGEAVLAVADGTVREVYRNNFYGTCVVITHAGGLESFYYGLAEQATVAAGDTVKAGDTIGSIGAGSHFEALEPVHLHMEMTLDGKYVNPGEYIA